MEEIDNLINQKNLKLHPSNIWNENTYYIINYSYCTIFITNIINIEQYDS